MSLRHTIELIRKTCKKGGLGLNVNNMFSMMHSIALSGYSARFLRVMSMSQVYVDTARTTSLRGH